jgi:hypothetical protein
VAAAARWRWARDSMAGPGERGNCDDGAVSSPGCAASATRAIRVVRRRRRPSLFGPFGGGGCLAPVGGGCVLRPVPPGLVGAAASPGLGGTTACCRPLSGLSDGSAGLPQPRPLLGGLVPVCPPPPSGGGGWQGMLDQVLVWVEPAFPCSVSSSIRRPLPQQCCRVGIIVVVESGGLRWVPVTEPPKIIPYYRLSLSTWPLSNNKELFCRFCRVKPGESLTT